MPASAATNISETYPMTFPASIHFQKHMDAISASTDVSCIVKVAPDFGNVLELWAAARQVVLRFERQGKMPLNSFMAMRFVRGSTVNLSPFKGDPARDVFAAIEVSAGHGALDFTNDLTKDQKDGQAFVEQLYDAWAEIEDVSAVWYLVWRASERVHPRTIAIWRWRRLRCSAWECIGASISSWPVDAYSTLAVVCAGLTCIHPTHQQTHQPTDLSRRLT